MIYKFKSKAAGDVIMLAPTGDRVLGLIGKSPAAKGIIEPADMPYAIQSLAAAIDADDTQRQHAQAAGEPLAGGEVISLRQRAWPMVEMMKRSHAANAPIVWGA